MWTTFLTKFLDKFLENSELLKEFVDGLLKCFQDFLRCLRKPMEAFMLTVLKKFLDDALEKF